jgi:high-affinity nickel-transport protein
MLAMDGLNGLWIARLLQRADERARMASRVMGLMVALISLAVAAFGLARWLRADLAAWYAGKELGLGISVIALLALVFLVAQGLPRPVVAPRSAR